MDIKQAVGSRNHFYKIISTTPVLICSTPGRWAVVMINTGPADIYIGKSGVSSSPTSPNVGMVLPNGQSFSDNYSQSDWWAVAASSSGTLSGFEVV